MLRGRSPSPFPPCAGALILAMLTPSTLLAQGVETIKARYTKYEYRIPMRDGVKLFTSVYVPKDKSQHYPILLTRTPYSCRPTASISYKSRPRPFGRCSASEGYIVVYQDVRGRWMSEGEFVDMRPHQADKRRPDRHRREHRYVRHDRLAGQARPGNNGRSACGASPIPASTRRPA